MIFLAECASQSSRRIDRCNIQSVYSLKHKTLIFITVLQNLAQMNNGNSYEALKLQQQFCATGPVNLYRQLSGITTYCK